MIAFSLAPCRQDRSGGFTDDHMPPRVHPHGGPCCAEDQERESTEDVGLQSSLISWVIG